MKKRKLKHLTSEQIARMAELYPDHTNKEIAETMGLSEWTVKSRAYKHGWHKSNDYITSICRKVAIKNNAQERINTPEAYAKREATMLKLHRDEKIRIKWGLEQKTKRHYRVEPIAKLFQRNRLQRLGYIIDETNLIAYYTPRTHRATRLEAIPRGTTKGSIHSYYNFRPYGEQELD